MHKNDLYHVACDFFTHAFCGTQSRMQRSFIEAVSLPGWYEKLGYWPSYVHMLDIFKAIRALSPAVRTLEGVASVNSESVQLAYCLD